MAEAPDPHTGPTRSARPTTSGDGGRAWRRPRRSPPPEATEVAESAAGSPAVPSGGQPPSDPAPAADVTGGDHETGARRAFRMRLGEAAEEEARLHDVQQSRRRLAKLRPWLSTLLMLGVFGLVLDAVAFVLALSGAPDLVVVVLIVAFLPPAVAAWALSLYCTIKLRDWAWAVVLGLLPLVVPGLALAVLLPAEFVFAFPLPTLIGAIVYPWRLRHELFPDE